MLHTRTKNTWLVFFSCINIIHTFVLGCERLNPVSTFGWIFLGTFLLRWNIWSSSTFSRVHFWTPWFKMDRVTVWMPSGRNQIKMMRMRNMELCCESWDQMITGCKHMKGWIIVNITSRVVKTSMFSVLEANRDNLKKVSKIFWCFELQYQHI